MDTLVTAINLTELENYGFSLKHEINTDHPWGSIQPSELKNYRTIREFEKKRKYKINWGIKEPMLKLEMKEECICIYIYLGRENSDEFIRNKNHIIGEYGQRFYDCIKKIKDRGGKRYCNSKRYILLDCSDKIQSHKIISFIHDSFEPW